MNRLIVLLLAASIAFLALPVDVQAVEGVKEKAKKHFQLGAVLYNEGNYEAALVEFRASYKYGKNWKVLFQIGTTLQALHDFVEAEKAFKEYLGEGGDDVPEGKRAEVEEILVQLASVIGSVIVTAPLDGASVYCDGDLVGTTPMDDPFRVPVGQYEVEVRMEGYVDFSAEVEVPGGESVTIEATLDKLEADASTGPALAGPAGAEATGEKAAPEPVTPLVEETGAQGRKKIRPGAFWGMAGTTGVLLVGTITLAALSLHNHNEFEDTPSDDYDERRSLRDKGKKLNLSTDIMLGVTALSAVTTIVLAVFTDFGKKERSDAAFVPSLNPGGFSLTLRF